MAKFMALTSRGLVDVLYDELKELGFKPGKKEPGGVGFESNWAECYRANLCLRTASRIIMPILDFPAYQNDDLYNNIKKHDFTKYIEPTGSIALDVNVRQSNFKDSRFVALKLKDGIVDQFREKYDVRPDVDKANPDLKIVARVVKNQVSVSIDTSGNTLSQRGYRTESGDAPIREHMAAALLKIAGWNKDIPLFDPMCGSGTFLIEAALMAQNTAPGSMRKSFGFQKLKTFQKEAWGKVLDDVLSAEVELPEDFKLYGSDRNKHVLKSAKGNAWRAGVDENIEWKATTVDQTEPPAEKGIMIVNPPYGERIGDSEEVKDSYRDLAWVLKQKYKGWTLWLISGNEDLTASLKLKASQKVRVWNGNIECRFLKYEIR